MIRQSTVTGVKMVSTARENRVKIWRPPLRLPMRALTLHPTSGFGRCSSGCVMGRPALGPRAASGFRARLGDAAGEGLRLGRGAGSQRRAKQRLQLAIEEE